MAVADDRMAEAAVPTAGVAVQIAADALAVDRVSIAVGQVDRGTTAAIKVAIPGRRVARSSFPKC